jgi:hypothetical protein
LRRIRNKRMLAIFYKWLNKKLIWGFSWNILMINSDQINLRKSPRLQALGTSFRRFHLIVKFITIQKKYEWTKVIYSTIFEERWKEIIVRSNDRNKFKKTCFVRKLCFIEWC